MQRENIKPGFNRKRKRNAHSQVLSNGNDGILELENRKQVAHGSKIDTEDATLEEIAESINKVWIDEKNLTMKKGMHISVLLSLTEADYFIKEEKSVFTICKEKLGLVDVLFSEQVQGSVERLLILFGDTLAIAKTLTLTAFIITSRLNNFVESEKYTIKSSNYRINYLIPWGFGDRSGWMTFNALANQHYLREYDISYPLPFNENPGLACVHLKGELSVLYLFSVSLLNYAFSIAKEEYFNELDIKQIPVIHALDNGNLYQEPETSHKMLQDRAKDLLNAIYNSSFIASHESDI